MVVVLFLGIQEVRNVSDALWTGKRSHKKLDPSKKALGSGVYGVRSIILRSLYCMKCKTFFFFFLMVGSF